MGTPPLPPMPRGRAVGIEQLDNEITTNRLFTDIIAAPVAAFALLFSMSCCHDTPPFSALFHAARAA